jgi:cytidine deaminase
MNGPVKSQVIEQAILARERAYAPYSKFAVGAALLTASQKIIVGANVENISYGLTICAERSAVFTAVSGGERSFAAMALATSGGVTPCGACRQVLMEFSPEMVVWLVDVERPGEPVEWKLADLLPAQFGIGQARLLRGEARP